MLALDKRYMQPLRISIDAKHNEILIDSYYFCQ